jgi:hypothetical protein
MAEALAKFRSNALWAQDHYDKLLAHVDRFVAVAEESILDVADSEEELRTKFRGHPETYITYVFREGLTWVT